MGPKDVFLPQNGAENGLIGLAGGRKTHAKLAFWTFKLAHSYVTLTVQDYK